MKKTFLIFVAIFIAAFANAQNTKEKVEFKLTLRDGSVMNGTSNITNVSLITDYGKLDVPIKNVTSLEFGILPDNANKQKIVSQLKQLSNTSEEQRKASYEELAKGSINSIPIVSEYLMSTDYTPSENIDYTPENLLSDLKSKFAVDDSYNDKDIVTIDYDYKMGGAYSLKSISLKTEFGSLEIPKEKIKTVDISYSSSDESSKTYKLLASKHISGNNNGGWLKTGITVKSGQKINITANGEVVLASLSNGKYNPNGAVGASSTSVGEEDYSGGSTYPTYGNVVYKVGESGTAMKAGANFNGTVNASGALYISIYETVFNAANTGSYNVKIKAN